MIRIAKKADLAAVGGGYRSLLLFEREHGTSSNWVLDLYPTEDYAAAKIAAGEMFVLEEDGAVRGSMVLNGDQPREYADVPWLFPADGGEVLVVHTLCVPPAESGRGYGGRMVSFAKACAAEWGKRVIRIDTWAENEAAKRLYLREGFRLAGYGESLLQGVIPEEQAFFEWRVGRDEKG